MDKQWQMLIKQITHFHVVFLEQITKTIKYYGNILTKGK